MKKCTPSKKAEIASALKKIIISSYFKKKVSLEKQRNGNCAPTISGTFHKPKYEKSVDLSGTATRSGSSQHVSMRDVNCKVSKVY